MSTTIKDIAKKVGVNPSTVSRVINGTASISEGTKSKIYEAMKELDYHPNVAARSLVNGNTFTIGLVIDAGNEDAFANAFFIQSVSAIERVSQEMGYNLLITNDANCENSNTVKGLIHEHKIDGIILPVSIMNDELISLLEKTNIPFVILGEPDSKWQNVFWVDMDNEQGSHLAVEHLLDAQYHAPALLVENKGTTFEKYRIKGFNDATEHSVIHWVIETKINMEAIENTIHSLYKGNDIPDSIICENNIVAFHVLQVLKKMGKRIPEDVGIITFDNYPLAQYMDPALTVVDVDTYKMGEEAAKFLFKKIKHQPLECTHYRIPTQIIARNSTIK